MPWNFPILDGATRKSMAVQFFVCVVVFVIGVMIGYFPDRKFGRKRPCTLRSAAYQSCSYTQYGYTWRTYMQKYMDNQLAGACVPKNTKCNDYERPRNYVVQHRNGRSINIDGNLDDEVWSQLPWSEPFLDMRSKDFPKPRLSTKFKMTWDNTNLYVGINVQETDLWGIVRDNDTAVYKDNAVEFLLDTDGDMLMYKQIQANVLGTINDLMFDSSPWDGGQHLRNWSSQVRHAVSAHGTINTPGDTDEYWTVEMAIPFTSLAENSTRTSPMPAVDETWFMQFGRSEWNLTVENNTYVKRPGVPADWWAWQPCGAINLHLQDRWGLIQFKRNPKDKKFNFSKWHLYRALFDAMESMKHYKALNGRYIDRVDEVGFPPYLMSGRCVEKPTVKLVQRNNSPDFEVTIKSRIIKNPAGNIRSDRYIWFN